MQFGLKLGSRTPGRLCSLFHYGVQHIVSWFLQRWKSIRCKFLLWHDCLFSFIWLHFPAYGATFYVCLAVASYQQGPTNGSGFLDGPSGKSERRIHDEWLVFFHLLRTKQNARKFWWLFAAYFSYLFTIILARCFNISSDIFWSTCVFEAIRYSNFP